MNEAIEPAKYRVEYKSLEGDTFEVPEKSAEGFDTAEQAFACLNDRQHRFSAVNGGGEYRVMQGQRVVPRSPRIKCASIEKATHQVGCYSHGKLVMYQPVGSLEDAHEAVEAYRASKAWNGQPMYGPEWSFVIEKVKQAPPAPKAESTPAPVDSKIAAATEKTPYDMIDMRALAGLSRVFQSGAKKHGHGNFLNGTDDGAPHRYMGGIYRHLAALQAPGGKFTWDSVTKLDDESGLPEIDHALCGLIMLRALLIEKGKLPVDPGKGKNLK